MNVDVKQITWKVESNDNGHTEIAWVGKCKIAECRLCPGNKPEERYELDIYIPHRCETKKFNNMGRAQFMVTLSWVAFICSISEESDNDVIIDSLGSGLRKDL